MQHPILIAGAAAVALAAASPAFATDSAQDGSAAAAALSEATALAGESGLKVAATASVLPAAVVTLGAVSVATPALAVGELANDSMDASTKAADLPPVRPRLVVSREIIVAQPAPSVPYDAQTAPAAKGAR